jgi:2-phosphoglycerate kinase
VAKIIVSKGPGEGGVPFLKGILVQSLLAAGIPFQEAYTTTQAVRRMLGNTRTVTTAELKACVAERLEQDFGPDARQNYEAEVDRKQEIIVSSDRSKSRFSTGILTRSLDAYGMDGKSLAAVVRRVQEAVQTRGQQEISSAALRHLIYQALGEHCSAEVTAHYLSRLRFAETGEPLIILMGGATGTGKSTISTELAYRLNVTRTQSTDMMREIIRNYLAPHVVPTLAYSSFEAWRGLPAAALAGGQRKTDDPLIAGYMNQYTNIEMALQATIARAVKERHDIIIEGVHVLPAELDLDNTGKQAVVVPVMLAVTNRQRLADQLCWRSREQPDRASSRYMEQLDAIWDLQSFLLNRADEANIRIIANWVVEDTVRDILQEVNLRVSERYPPDPKILE